MTMTAAGAPSSVTIQGRVLTFPVEVRQARWWTAQYLVPAAAAERLVAPTGLELARPFPGRAVVSLAVVRYEDGDLGRYHEVGVAFLVRLHDAKPASPREAALEVARGTVGAYIHHLPVNQEFTLEAGRTIWGYPKFMADIRIVEKPGWVKARLSHEGRHILTLTMHEGGPLTLPSIAVPTYTYLDDVLRVTRWTMRGTNRGRPGGSRLVLGDHPIGDELRSLGLPKRGLLTSSVRNFRARFEPATRVP